jgi:hypothetical protein
MENVNYHVFGAGLDDNDLRYIDWTERAVDDEKERIASLPAWRAARDRAGAGPDSLDAGRVSIFEIECAKSIEDARGAVASWCGYFRSLGLNVVGGDH